MLTGRIAAVRRKPSILADSAHHLEELQDKPKAWITENSGRKLFATFGQ